MHNVFISYHHDNDQYYKDELLRINSRHSIFNDNSVNTGEISDVLSDEAIRVRIRDEYLRDTTVTILLVGTGTWGRKHIDWEIYSSMFDGNINKKSGILVINLPSTNCNHCTVSHKDEKEIIHPEHTNWININRAEYEDRYKHMPDRIIDNLVKSGAKVSVISWDKIAADPEKLRFLVNASYDDRASCEYDLSRPMRRNNAGYNL